MSRRSKEQKSAPLDSKKQSTCAGPRRSGSAKIDKNSPEYLEQRAKNNVAVQRCRQKAKENYEAARAESRELQMKIACIQDEIDRIDETKQRVVSLISEDTPLTTSVIKERIGPFYDEIYKSSLHLQGLEARD